MWYWDRLHSSEIRFINGKLATNYKIRTESKNVYPSLLEADEAFVLDSVVIYPEIIEGNPLGQARVIRWALNKPGVINRYFSCSPSDIFYFYSASFYIPELKQFFSNILNLTVFKDQYRQSNFGSRSGTCYMIRKGKVPSQPVHLPGDTCVDGWSDAQLVDAFNKFERFISYDPYTMYSAYASICGCDSVVVPVAGVSVHQWYQSDHQRHGLAYGFSEIEAARRTRPFLLERMAAVREDNLASVSNFLVDCSLKWGGPA